MHRILALAAAALNLCCFGFAQDTDESARAPLEISSIKILDDASSLQNLLRFDMRNCSDKSLIGYVLKIRLKDQMGALRDSGNYSSEKLPTSPVDGKYSPGETWTDQYQLPVTSVDSLSVRYTDADLVIDYVLFADGSSWGPNASGQGTALGKVRRGAEIERARLKRILADKGLQALLDDLLRDVDASIK